CHCGAFEDEHNGWTGHAFVAMKRPSLFDFWHWPHWLRKPFLVVAYLPFWRSINAIRRAWSAAFDHRVNLVTCEELFQLTELLDEHPQWWHHPCMCRECRSCE